QAYQHYQRLYPAGLNVGIAESRIAELARLEAGAFATARRIDTETAYDDYLARYPWGRNAAEADALRAERAAPRLAALERAQWAEADRRDIIDLYEAYLADWPAGPNAARAQSRLDALWRTDQGAFVRAARSGSPVELEEFLRAWPRSSYAADARRELEAIRVRDDEAWRRALAINTSDDVLVFS